MNFFDAQERARRTTRWLAIVYTVATVLIVAGVTLIVAATLYVLGTPGQQAPASVLIAVAVLATLLILGSSLYKTSALSAGGSRVASDMGGTPIPPDVQDPLRRRLRNVVEEMSIASGVPVPAIYVLEAEDGINAFAAGYSPDDAAIAVTRGALDRLNRDELQAVVAHEFSHILNGDMRISIRMMGVLFGIMVLGIIGRIVLRGGYHGGALASRRGRGAPAVVAIGAGLVILGWIGVILARLIKAGVSRQRELLADASAVQFTRQSQGLASALRKIGGYPANSYLRSVDPEEISHMLFARGSRSFSSLFATHPPLAQRIRILDPSFREEDFAGLRAAPQALSDDAANAMRMGLADAPAASRRTEAPPAAAASGEHIREQRLDDLADTVGKPDQRQIEFARRLRLSVPGRLYDAAHSQPAVMLLTLALVLDRTGSHVDRQLHLISEQLGPGRASAVRAFYEELQEAGPQYALPLLEISMPALRMRPAAQLEFLIGLVRRLVETDGEIDFHEFCFYRILTAHLRGAMETTKGTTNKGTTNKGTRAADAGPRVSRRAARRAAMQLLHIVASRGHADSSEQEEARRAGIARLDWSSGSWREPRDSATAAAMPAGDGSVAELERSLDLLRHVGPARRKSLIEALSATVGHDRKITLSEAELMRAICAALDCPLPPIITDPGTAPPRSGKVGSLP